uniref:Uncharacterized protein n=1 Tax=Rhodnius prolixus TaxID=13249 RepID=T1HLX8_RHOPR
MDHNFTDSFFKIVYAIFSGSDRLGGITENDLAKLLRNEGFAIDRRQLRGCLDDGKTLGLFIKKTNNCYRLTKALYDSLSNNLEKARRNLRAISRHRARRSIRRKKTPSRKRNRGRSAVRKKKLCEGCKKNKACNCPPTCTLCPRASARRKSSEIMKKKEEVKKLTSEEPEPAAANEEYRNSKSPSANQPQPAPTNGFENKGTDTNTQPGL